MSSNSVFHKELVITNMSASNRDQAIISLGEKLYKNGYVKDTFINAVLERERNSPTGLPTQPLGVALPHIACEYVERTAIAVGLLSKPVEFFIMGALDKTVDVSLVFLMAIQDPANQIHMLQGLAQLFHKPHVLEQLIKAGGPLEIVEILRHEIE